MDNWSPTNLVPLDKWSLEYSVCPGTQAAGISNHKDQIDWGPFVRGDTIGWGPFVQGINFMGIICPGRQEVFDRKSGIKWVRDQMQRSCNKILYEYIWAVRLGVRRGNTAAAVALSIHF